MPKKYVPTKKGKPFNILGTMEEAVISVREMGWSVRKAASTFHVPKSTIGDRFQVGLKYMLDTVGHLIFLKKSSQKLLIV